MSIDQFSAAMKNHAVQSWFSAEKAAQVDTKTPNVLVHGTLPYRASEGVSQKNSFIITKDTIRSMLESMGRDTRNTNKIFNKFLTVSSGAGSTITKELINVPIRAANGRIVNVEAVIFPRISFDSITSVVNNILEAPEGEIAKSFEKGHVLGLATNLLSATTNRLDSEVESTVESTTAKETIISQLNNVIAYYRQLDFETANLQPADTLEVYARSDKVMQATGNTVYTIEFQPKALNQKSGKEISKTFGYIRELFDPKSRSREEYLDLVNKIRNNVTDPTFRKQLLTLRSSPNLLEMINKQIRDTLKGVAEKQEYHVPMMRVASKKGSKPEAKKVRESARRKIAELEKLKRKVTAAKSPKLDALKGSFSLASLQLLINMHLQHVVSANMGNEGYPGGQRKILNYRTGEFAASVKVERLSLSKAGMVTAFYDYMRYPYQTFEPGYAQGHIKTRNPRLLIAKSVAEIAAIKVANRMRSVLI